MKTTKVCCHCKQTKPLDAYSKDRHKAGGLSSECRACHSRFNKADYKRNLAGYVTKAKAHRKAQVEYLRGLVDEARNRPCTDCGGQFPLCAMQFDHVRGLKRMEVSAMWSRGYSTKAVLAEIAKCEIVCANCHAVRTYKRRKDPVAK